MKRLIPALCLLAPALLFAVPANAQDEEDAGGVTSGTVSALEWRNIGPAFMSGRVIDIAMDPDDRNTWYVAAASGGVWKTENAGVTFRPIFDSYGSYSIGTVTVDPRDSEVVWVGTGENNSQRSVGYGDGIYKSVDGGRSFEKIGLESSEHVARILIDPRDSDVVYVAAQGPLWSAGGDRGLFKTTDGGERWDLVLDIDEHTGVSEVVMDPRDPDILYAVSYQRRRHVWTLINGGPGSGLWKSTDAGATWKKINKGLPGVDLGRIGLTISPIDPDVLYAIVEAADGEDGFFRSANGGENWSRMSDHVSGSPQYYNEIYADPHKFDRVYSLDTYMMVSEDGGRNWERLGEQWKHVDNHALAFDPEDPDHLLIGSDGGLYETWDRGETYDFKENLPITQFYKVAVDYDEPFYNLYGGTQDNATQGGPSRTRNVHGIRNSDWVVTVFGDGFDPAVDPEDPNIVYSQWQYGGLVRYDRRTEERVDIKPQEEPDGPPLRWNWDSALLISPHDHTRLYYAAQMLFRSDDRGDSWRAVSGDLTRNMDRNQLEVMGRIWSVDAVAKNASTSFYGTIVALSESPIEEGLLYAGTDDGLIQVTEDGGESWSRIESFPGVPERTYVNDLEASFHDPNTVYAAFNNHKMGDFQPYVLKSTDRGQTWTSITGDLPERGSVYTLALDHENENLLFAGTEFGAFFTVDGGESWIQLKSGMPTIAIRELEIQRRENDLVAASFGRGFFILDDYSPLRALRENLLEQEAHLFQVKDAWWYLESAPLAGGEKAFQGANFYTAPNPPFGATFTFYLKGSLESRKELRQEEERERAREGRDNPYPSWEDLRAEDREEDPVTVVTIRDEEGQVIRRLAGPTSSGTDRITWDLRYSGLQPATSSDDLGPLVVPGSYTVSLDKRVDGVTTNLVPPTPFRLVPLGAGSLPEADREAVLAFQKQTAQLERAVLGANAAAQDAAQRIDHIKTVSERTPSLGPGVREEARSLELRLLDLRERLTGDRTRPRRNEPGSVGIIGRIRTIIGGHWFTTSGPTNTHRRSFEIAETEFLAILQDLTTLIETDLVALEARLEAAGAPWAPGRQVPRYRRR
jgi:photosystem II stability/assembly factor-like uncharacterized protein